ncbi:hypothetical protein CWC48_27260 [Pseudomonas sp. S10E 269]|nr:hypothetical protein B1R45_13175 [Pseudomonas azotoformans]PJK33177.1 hypothetical protein CWC49_07700 [Pseudomonas sp. S09F 262]PJK42670.1 hypothetical protein CWC48_27260 [Pseudomonas sp. S10E 269]
MGAPDLSRAGGLDLIEGMRATGMPLGLGAMVAGGWWWFWREGAAVAAPLQQWVFGGQQGVGHISVIWVTAGMGSAQRV